MTDAKDRYFHHDKIFKLGLRPFEIAVFFALRSHGGKNSLGIFPAWARLQGMTGMSRSQVARSLKILSSCNIIIWDRGRTGRANTYQILGIGAWSKNAPVSIRDGSKRSKPVSIGDSPRVYLRRVPVSNRDPNIPNTNINQLTSSGNVIFNGELGDLIQRARDRGSNIQTDK